MDESYKSIRANTKTADEVSSIAKKRELLQWFVMRDLKRSNAKFPAYKLLEDLKIEYFTPMVWKLVVRNGKRMPVEVPFMQDLLFVHDSRKVLDPIVERTNTLQYRFLKDGYRTPMTVRDADMERFIKAVEVTNNPCFYSPKEITPDMLGRLVRIIGGPLDGYIGRLLKVRGARIKRLLVELPSLITVAVEVMPDYVEFV